VRIEWAWLFTSKGDPKQLNHALPAKIKTLNPHTLLVSRSSVYKKQ
jgi:hypothetical protein